MTWRLKISQGALHGTWLCSEASSTLLNGVINNNKAIIFYSSFVVIVLFLNFVSFRFFFPVSSLLLQSCANATEPKKTCKIPPSTKQNPNTKLKNYFMVDSSQWHITTLGPTIQKTWQYVNYEFYGLLNVSAYMKSPGFKATDFINTYLSGVLRTLDKIKPSESNPAQFIWKEKDWSSGIFFLIYGT